MDKHLELNQNPLVNYFKKHPEEFTKADFIDYVRQHEVRLVNFMYPGEDGKLKTLNFVVNNLEYLETILSEGERVDGSSLFPSFVEAGNSDLYVVPRFRSAFLDPFAAEPTLCFLCSFYSKDGSPFDASPSETLVRAAASFREATGMEFEAMGELEYYVIAPEQPLFPTPDQRGYHESAPFAKFGAFRQECMKRIAQTGGLIKYGHSEVGNFSSQGRIFEQNEIEFLPCAVESAADQLLLAKWVIRNLAYEQGLDITFAPKIVVGEAGSGLHIHMRITKDGHSLMLDNDLKLSTVARRAIAGMMKQKSHVISSPCAPSGSPHQRMLGRQQPFRTGARSSGMDKPQGHVCRSKSTGETRAKTHHRQTNLRNAFARLLGRHLSAHGRSLRCRTRGTHHARG